jgi:hypothetical protein
VDPRWPAGAASPADAVDRLDGPAFFTLACSLVPEHRPPTADRHVLDRAAPLGLFTACDEPWPGDAAARAAAAGAERGKASIRAEAAREGRDADGRWQIDYRHGDFGTDYLCRAVASRTLFDADVAVDALPATTRVDADGRALSGSARYLLRFAPDQLPPVHGFWALGAGGGTVSLGDRDGLIMDADGSLSIRIQHARPVRAERVNWLPVPAGPFTLRLRLHWPADEVLRGRWAPPPVERIA